MTWVKTNYRTKNLTPNQLCSLMPKVIIMTTFQIMLNFAGTLAIPSEAYIELTPKGSFVIGQEQDGILTGGFFDIQQAFSGKLAQVEMWQGNLSPEEIMDIANCKIETTRPESKIISWNNNWTVNDVIIEDVDLEQLCVQDPLLNQFIWSGTIPYDKFRGMCDTLGAQLPILNSSDVSTGLSTKLHHDNLIRLLFGLFAIHKKVFFYLYKILWKNLFWAWKISFWLFSDDEE